jgi:hypothetical protein
VDFSIFYEFQSCYECAEKDYSDNNPNCLGGGRYCCMDPDSYGAANVICLNDYDFQRVLMSSRNN